MFKIEPNNIYLGDCLELMTKMKNKSIDLIFTSPPYFNAKKYSSYKTYEEYLEFITLFIKQCYNVLSDDGFFILNTSPVIIPRKKRSLESTRLPIPFDTFFIAQSLGFKYIDDIIWKKPDGASSRAKKFSDHRRPMAYKPFTITEYLFVFRKNNARLIDFGIRKHSKQQIEKSLVLGNYERTNVWEIPPSHNKNHPASFPDKLAENVILYYSFINDIILDPFLGSGTTCKIAKKFGRKYLGFEINEQYFNIAKNNINKL